MGANAGISTPYIEPVPPPEPSLDFPFFPMPDDDLAYVNGRRVPCEFEGITLGCSRADSLMRGGAALPGAYAQFQHDSRFQFDYHLGTFWMFGPIGVRPGHLGDGGSGTVVRTTDRYVWGWTTFTVSWGPQTTQTRDSRPVTPGEAAAIQANVVKNLSQGCADFIGKLINKVQELGGGKIISTDVNTILEKIIASKNGGVFGYLSRSNAHATGSWAEDRPELYLPVANYLTRFNGIDGNGRPMRRSIEASELSSMSQLQQRVAWYQAFRDFSTSQNGAATTIHELIHLAIDGGATTEAMEAAAALSFDGEDFVVPDEVNQMTNRDEKQRIIGNAASAILDDRLAKGCGWSRRTLDARMQSFIRRR